MKIWRLFMLAFAACLLAAPLAQKAYAQGWALSQYTPYGGQHQLYFSHEGMRINQKKMGITIVAKAPDWKLTMYNDRAKTYYQTTYEDWKQRSAKGQGFVSSFQRQHKFRNVAPRKGTTSSIAGMACTQYFLGPQGQPGSIICWLSNDISVPPQLTNILMSEFGLPNMNGVPLKVERVDDHGKKVTDLNTEASQMQHLTASNFTYPPNYKRVQEDIEVLVPDDTSQTAADLLNDLSTDPSTQKELNQLIQSSKTKSAATARPAATAPAYARTAATAPAAQRPAAGRSSGSGDINSLIDSFLKGK
jgi:hypothetical protein